jgi:hypothetical protein
MQIATAGDPGTGSTGAAASIRPSSASAPPPDANVARSPIACGAAPARGATRAIPQNPLR